MEVISQNAHYLKGHASWLYCDGCGKTVAYLCYVTYSYFRFEFECACGCRGFAENRLGDVPPEEMPSISPGRTGKNNRFCCPEDQTPLFSPVPKNLKAYRADVVCKACGTRCGICEG